MGEKSPLLTFALCTSLTVHLLGLSAMAWWYVANTPPPKWAAIDREKVLIESIEKPKTKPKTPEPPPRKPKKRPPPAAFEMPKPSDLPKDDSGETHGTGTANRSTPGDRPMQAIQGYEQADLMRDMPDPSQLDPSLPMPAAAGVAVGGQANKQSVAQVGRYTPDFVAESKALADPDADTAKPVTLQRGVGPLPITPSEKENIPVASGAPTPVTVATTNARQTEVAQAVHGHKAVSSDTESVAFSKAATSVNIHSGRMEARQGLRVSYRIPRFGLASMRDMESMGGYRLVIVAQVDADGNVVDPEIGQSSGSRNIDLDFQNAAYNWTFEPPKDKDGHPMAATWTITCD